MRAKSSGVFYLVAALALLAPADPWTQQWSGRAHGESPAARSDGKQSDGESGLPIITRLFFQDFESKTLRWADVRLGVLPEVGPVGDVEGFVKIDPQKQGLVQMRESQGLLMVGVRDKDKGKTASGWVLLNTGVAHEEHGDHHDWKYSAAPAVVDSRIDTQQGNPAHLYSYDGVFYLANDVRNGYTRLDPAEYHATSASGASPAARFIPGGGNHITLAVVAGQVGYSAWIDGGGPNKGRVDVSRVRADGDGEIAYSFHLPYGGIHGATANEDKVFFAPARGICWVTADPELTGSPGDVEVHHLDLGTGEDDKPLRTGAFTNFANHVLFVTGSGPTAALCLVDAKQAKPTVTKLALAMKEGNSPVTPSVVKTSAGTRFAFVFHNHDQDVEVDDELSVIDLDPNRDGDLADATVFKRMKVGKSKVDGHYGHHAVAFDADRRRAYFTNPGEGSIVVLSLQDLQPRAEFKVGGIPTAIVARGGKESDE